MIEASNLRGLNIRTSFVVNRAKLFSNFVQAIGELPVVRVSENIIYSVVFEQILLNA